MAKANLKLASMRDPSREALAAAIADVATARKNLSDARAAASKAEEQVWSASARLMALREESALASPADAIINALASGNTDIAELDRPQAATRAKIDNAEQELASWRRALAAAQAAIPVRENALDWARRHLKDAVAEVVRTTDIGAMIARAERARDVLLAERCRLMQIQSSLPWLSLERKKIDSFLESPFLAHESTGGWLEHPVVSPWREAFEALHVDAAAAMPAIQTEATVVILPSNGRE
jgi:hypothetical protein